MYNTRHVLYSVTV